ncbi:uncharacterized protein LOC125506606 [Triticum urartu]|uniref:uncharacterized protein LOC125506606 n=1 Tax=Triticum urartu TaxID=4572 RepID=UPI0020443013|nr:uncharacterized protein LOC125506606 [Triticum urartu]
MMKKPNTELLSEPTGLGSFRAHPNNASRPSPIQRSASSSSSPHPIPPHPEVGGAAAAVTTGVQSVPLTAAARSGLASALHPEDGATAEAAPMATPGPTTTRWAQGMAADGGAVAAVRQRRNPISVERTVVQRFSGRRRPDRKLGFHTRSTQGHNQCCTNWAARADCARRIYANWSKTCRDKAEWLENFCTGTMYIGCCSTTLPQGQGKASSKDTDGAAEPVMRTADPVHWCKAWFSGQSVHIH